MKNLIRSKNFLYSILAIVAFAAIALLYNFPVISGSQAISQPDIVNFRGSAEEMIAYQNSTGENVYWSDAMFGGMPTYQTGAKYNYHIIKSIDNLLRFLPRPADYIFLLFFGFFILGQVLFKNWKYALLGAVFFAMGTYFFIIIEAGHNSKVHAIAYFAPLAGGIILLYQKRYLLGAILTALFMALELSANHPQMTYYFAFSMVIFVLIELFRAFKNKELEGFFKASALAVFAVLLAFGMNSTGLLATYEYSQSSTRGQNDITIIPNKATKGLDKDYITQWSYGKLETLNLFIPNFMGGGSVTDESNKENLAKAIQQNAKSTEEFNYLNQYLPYLSTYWGNQPFTSGPAYQGAIVCFFFLIGLIMVPGRWKWWLGLSTLVSILLAWGKNFSVLTDFLIDTFPLYDKFRAVSSALVIAEFAMPLLATICVWYLIQNKEKFTKKEFKKFLLSSEVILIILLIFYFFGSSLFSFSSDTNGQFPNFMNEGIIQDRVDLFKADVLRTFIFVLAASGLVYVYLKDIVPNKYKTVVVLSLAVLSLIDLWGVDKRYLSEENFIPAKYVKYPFPTEMNEQMYAEAQANPTIMQIVYNVNYNKSLAELKQQDQSHYRVFNMTADAFNEAHTSYFASSIGGYHGAKLQSIQNVLDVYFGADSIQSKKLGTFNKQDKVLNLLNAKYIVVGNPQEPEIIQNPDALGNAWFVKELKKINSANDALLSIAKEDLSKVAVTQKESKTFSTENSSVNLKSYSPNRLVYESNNPQEGFAVFSEIFYKNGWKASIDGKPQDIIQTNYLIRGLNIPSGNHTIIFEFKPEIIEVGNKITMASNILFVLLILGSLGWYYKTNLRADKTS